MRYRKLPAVIEAFRWTGGPDQEEEPEWILNAIKAGSVWFHNEGAPDVKLVILTPDGVLKASVGDFIIHSVSGEIYPCKPDIFARTYEQVN